MKPNARNARFVQALALAAGVLGLGCASQNARDEYNYVRSVRVAPTEISRAEDAPTPIVLEADFTRQRWAEATRPGSARDDVSVPR